MALCFIPDSNAKEFKEELLLDWRISTSNVDGKPNMKCACIQIILNNLCMIKNIISVDGLRIIKKELTSYREENELKRKISQ